MIIPIGYSVFKATRKDAFKDIAGQRFGRLVAIIPVIKDGKKIREAAWLCVCDCGVEKPVDGASMRRGVVVSCGCFQRERLKEAVTKHGCSIRHKRTGAYTVWYSMKQRCDNPRHRHFYRYGGRGISYDPRWSDFATFLADMGEPPLGLTLDRIDNDGNYDKGNCRWATHRDNCNNRFYERHVLYNGRSFSIADLARETGFKETTLRARRAHGWSDDELTGPFRRSRWTPDGAPHRLAKVTP